MNRSATVSSASRTPVRFDVCVDTLMNGCINSFVQLFTLSHRDPVCVDELAQTMFAIPDERLEWLQERLVSAELRRRRGDFRGVYQEFLQLGEWFELCKDMEQADRFYAAGLQACVESLDRALEEEAHEQYGQFCERRGHREAATHHYEARLRLVELTGDPAAKIKACRPVVNMHIKLGQQAQNEGNMAEAKDLYEKAAMVSRACRDPVSEARAYSALGSVTVLLGDMHKALEYQKRFLVVSRESKSADQESQASLEVARIQQQLGHHQEAVSSLNAALALAQESNNLRAICEACRQLGEAYKSVGDSKQAVNYFKKTFKVARDIGDTSLIEASRAMLGFSLGELYFMSAGGGRGFLDIVTNDIQAQLKWLSTNDMQ